MRNAKVDVEQQPVPGSEDPVPEPATAADVADGLPPEEEASLGFWMRFWPIASFIVGVVVWQILSYTTNSIIFVPLERIAQEAFELAVSGELGRHVSSSGLSVLLGYTASVVVGVTGGVLIGLSRTLRLTVEPWLYALYSIPIVALAPVFIIVFGIGLAGHVAVVFTITVFAILVNTTAGIRTAEQQYIDVARAYCGSRWQVIQYVMLPSSVPFILTGMRLGLTRALIGVVIAEMFGARAGIGIMILQAQQSFNTAQMYVGVIILAAAGIIGTSVLERLENRLASWRPNN